MSYGKHQTFFLRSNWIYKGIHAVINPDFHEDIFVHSKKYYRILGLGSSMLKSLRYWLEATCIVDFINGEHVLTSFGKYLSFNDIGANSSFSKILIQYFLVSNFRINSIEMSHAFYWLFNINGDRLFDREYLVSELEKWDREQKELNGKINYTSINTLKSDVDVLVNTYTKGNPLHPEDKTYSILADLRLLKEDGRNIYKLPLDPMKYDYDAFMYLIYLWRDKSQDLSIDSLIENENSIGKAFNFSRNELLEISDIMVNKGYPIQINRTNNLNYIKIVDDLSGDDFMKTKTEDQNEYKKKY
jgi:hypothetical protein